MDKNSWGTREGEMRMPEDKSWEGGLTLRERQSETQEKVEAEEEKRRKKKKNRDNEK